VITAVSVDRFKNRLDKFWANEEAHFDYKANYLAAVLQDASKSYVAFFCYYALQCEMWIQRPQAYVHSCTFMFMITDNTHSIWKCFFFENLQVNRSCVTV